MMKKPHVKPDGRPCLMVHISNRPRSSCRIHSTQPTFEEARKLVLR
jgi:hypothetical protein